MIELPEEVSLDEYNFFNENIRFVWHKQEEEWYFSIVDVVKYLSESSDPKQYIKKMRSRDSELNSNWGTICTLVPMRTKDGKMRRVQASKIDGLFRIIQAIPSPKAEPFKMWLAQVGKERIDETVDPEISINRAVENYKKKGYSDKWIAQRLRGIEMRKELTDEWQRAGVKAGREFAILTDMLTNAWSGMSTREYKEFKDLKKENLRDNMTNTELALNMLAEVSTTELSKSKNPKGFNESKNVTLQGGTIAGNARKELEKALGKSIVSSSNAKDTKLLDEDL
ncbi:BRO family protein [Anaerovorax odorimutans]|uniref:BRO family protein n=1 Tax=Anaerovorax odorimutans TaxID=109327 RepID=A0ABT1RRA6_9FIRM|nr:BRO family protein [Anaerovorax odorimutans]MCQ4637703.1 BRO family protein [Anaerovorax odorimutans]